MKNSASRTLIFLCLMITAVGIFVFALSENVNKTDPMPVSAASIFHQQAGLVNINTADIDELTQLKGIGEVRAQKIIDFRTKNGYFVTPEDIMRVDGIGEKLFERIKEYITV